MRVRLSVSAHGCFPFNRMQLVPVISQVSRVCYEHSWRASSKPLGSRRHDINKEYGFARFSVGSALLERYICGQGHSFSQMPLTCLSLSTPRLFVLLLYFSAFSCFDVLQFALITLAAALALQCRCYGRARTFVRACRIGTPLFTHAEQAFVASMAFIVTNLK